MAVVPDKVLKWLFGVLRTEYRNVDRTYNDAASTLAAFPSLSPRTEVYTFENGKSSLLLLLSGTIPVEFRGQTYRFPVALWIPHAYPNEGPMAFVVPTQGMAIRPGQHVSHDGRIYHPYLAQWSRYWDKSTIVDFVAVLRDVFAKDPPVMSQQQANVQAQTGPRHPTSSPAGPPRPPPPAESSRSNHGTPFQPDQPGAEIPPQLPPKGFNVDQSSKSLPETRYSQPPPLPPVPGGPRTPAIQSLHGWQQGSSEPQQYMPSHRHRLSVEIGSSQIPSARPLNTTTMPLQQETRSPVSPMESAQYQQQYPLHQQHGHPTYQLPHNAGQPFLQHQTQPGPSSRSVSAHHHGGAIYPHHPIPQSQQLQQPKQPPIDLLTSPLDVTLPSQNGSLEPLPAPPIPRNPEKESLLQALSQTLVAQTHRTLDSNKSAIAPLLAQQSALLNAQQVLQAELDHLHHLDSILETNKTVLAQAMLSAEGVMRDAAHRKRPEIDEILVCPTVVGSQLYNLVADQKACEEARLVLVRGLDRGRISLDVFVKQTRSCAREEFLKKALRKKVAKGMGLDERAWNGR